MENTALTARFKSMINGHLATPMLLVALLAMVILPLPAFMLDLLFSFNIALSLTIVLASIAISVATLLGVLLGVTLALTVTDLVAWVERMLGIQFLSADVYFISYLPSQLIWSDVGMITLAALAISFVATLYPAWRASRTQPAEALRYE